MTVIGCRGAILGIKEDWPALHRQDSGIHYAEPRGFASWWWRVFSQCCRKLSNQPASDHALAIITFRMPASLPVGGDRKLRGLQGQPGSIPNPSAQSWSHVRAEGVLFPPCAAALPGEQRHTQFGAARGEPLRRFRRRGLVLGRSACRLLFFPPGKGAENPAAGGALTGELGGFVLGVAQNVRIARIEVLRAGE